MRRRRGGQMSDVGGQKTECGGQNAGSELTASCSQLKMTEGNDGKKENYSSRL